MPTAIEWTDDTWNPVRARRRLESGAILVGHHCEHASDGCRNCYAEAWNRDRLGTRLPFKPGHRKDVEIFLDEKVLMRPLSSQRPRNIFAGSMTDLFADWVTDVMLDRIFAVAALAAWHHFQFVTKRALRLYRYTNDPDTPRRVRQAALAIAATSPALTRLAKATYAGWPLRNVIGIVSVEDQMNANIRIPYLLGADLYRRGLSCEPLLGPVDLTRISLPGGYANALHFVDRDGDRSIDWVIAGGESGRDARPMHPDWALALRDQCAAADVAFFFKQWGEWAHAAQFGPDTPEFMRAQRAELRSPDPARVRHLGDISMLRIGKRKAGRLLDGVTHDAMPEFPA